MPTNIVDWPQTTSTRKDTDRPQGLERKRPRLGCARKARPAMSGSWIAVEIVAERSVERLFALAVIANETL